MGLLNGVAPAVSGVIRDAVNDSVLGRVIVYRRYTGQTTFDEAAGHPSDIYEDLSVRAAALTHSERSVAGQGLNTKVQAGDHVYLIQASSLLVNGLQQKDFSEKDIILDEGEERKIINLNWALSFAVQITVAG